MPVELAGRLNSQDPVIQRDAALTLLERADLAANEVHLR